MCLHIFIHYCDQVNANDHHPSNSHRALGHTYFIFAMEPTRIYDEVGATFAHLDFL